MCSNYYSGRLPSGGICPSVVVAQIVAVWRLRHSLQPADILTCVVLRTLGSYDNRSFAATGPRLWNSLPVQLHNPDITCGLFWLQLKGHLFRGARIRRSVTSDVRAIEKHLLTCLLTWKLPSVLWRCWLGGRKGIRPVKNWVEGCWCGYLSGARCRLSYGPADAIATHCLLLQ